MVYSTRLALCVFSGVEGLISALTLFIMYAITIYFDSGEVPTARKTVAFEATALNGKCQKDEHFWARLNITPITHIIITLLEQ